MRTRPYFVVVGLNGRARVCPMKSKARGWLDNRWVLLALRRLIGGLFIYAGVVKFQNPQLFADNIAMFQMLPRQIINLLSLSLPPFEVITGTLLVVGRWQRVAIFSILVLTLVFALALGQALLRGLEVDCGCFGAGEPSLWKTWAALGRDILLLAGAGMLYHRTCLSGIVGQTVKNK